MLFNIIPSKVKLYSGFYLLHILQAITTESGRKSRNDAARVGMQEQVKLFSWLDCYYIEHRLPHECCQSHEIGNHKKAKLEARSIAK